MTIPYQDKIAQEAKRRTPTEYHGASDEEPCASLAAGQIVLLTEAGLCDLALTSEDFNVVVRILRSHYELFLIQEGQGPKFGLQSTKTPGVRRAFKRLGDCLALAVRISRSGKVYFDRSGQDMTMNRP